MNWIATFFSHFGAIRYMQLCKESGISAKLTPVPRDLSSSCGTCVRYTADTLCPMEEIPEDVEQIVAVLPEGYRVYFRAEDC